MTDAVDRTRSREVTEPYTAREAGQVSPSESLSKAGLAHAAGANDGNYARAVIERGPYVAQDGRAADECVDLGWKAVIPLQRSGFGILNGADGADESIASPCQRFCPAFASVDLREDAPER